MLDVRGCGMASVRFICGTQVLFLIIVYTYKDIHKELEKKLAELYKTRINKNIVFPICVLKISSIKTEESKKNISDSLQEFHD